MSIIFFSHDFAGAPIMCGRPCLESNGRCFQDPTCGPLLMRFHSACRDVILWNGEGDLPACCTDCRETVNMLSKLPNGKEMVCCDCGDDMACAMGKAKMAAACPNRLSCKTVGMHACINDGRHVCVCVCVCWWLALL